MKFLAIIKLMKHAEHLVDIVDKHGMIAGSKQRQEINKATDLYHTVFLILRTPDQKLILSKIPDRKVLPNLYPGRIGATAATIRRHNESPDEASVRAIKSELFIEDMPLTHLDDTYLTLPDGHKTYTSIYCGVHAMPKKFNHKSTEALLAFSHEALNDAVQSNTDQFPPTFLAIWQKYQNDLFSV